MEPIYGNRQLHNKAVSGFILVVKGDLVISIFILGELIVAVIVMTSAAFLGLIRDIWQAITAKKSRGKFT